MEVAAGPASLGGLLDLAFGGTPDPKLMHGKSEAISASR